MSISDKITRLQTAKNNIATAITTKGGTVNAGDGLEDFAIDIATIPSGGSTPTRTVDWRPPDMPQYEGFPLINKALYCYMTFDKSYTPKTDFKILSYYTDLKIEIGIYENNAFSILSTYTFVYQETKTISLPVTNNQFLIFRFSATRSNVSQGVRITDVMPFVEFYGYASNSYTWFRANPYLKYYTLFGAGDLATTSTAVRLVRLDISNTTSQYAVPTYNNICFGAENYIFSQNYSFEIPSGSNVYSGLGNCLNETVCRVLDLSTFDTSENISLWNSLKNGKNLEVLNLSNFDCSNVRSCDNFLSGNALLKDIIINEHTILPSLSFNISASTELTVQSLLNVLNALPTITTTQTLTIGAVNKQKLTAEQLLIGTNKGWTIS